MWAMEIEKDIITSLAALAAVVIGYFGLRTWRLQLKATADSDLARRVLIALYKVNSHMSYIRRPMREVSLPPGVAPNDFRAVEAAYEEPYNAEWKEFDSELVELRVACIEAQAVWDRQFLSYLAPLNVCVGQLRDHISEYLMTKRHPGYESYIEPKDMRKVMYGMGGETDEFGKEIAEAVASLDEKTRPHFLI